MARDDEDQKDMLHDLTPVRRRRLKSSIAIADSPADRIAYQHTVLCQTCLPYRDPGDSVRIWERQQGAISLAVEAGRVRDPRTQKFVEVGLPYGSRPRLIGGERVKLLTIDIPASLHVRIKAQCALRGTKMADEIRRLLEERFPPTERVG